MGRIDELEKKMADQALAEDEKYELHLELSHKYLKSSAEKAIEHVKLAYELADTLDEAKQIQASINLGSICYNQSEHQVAIRYHSQALQNELIENFPEDKAESLNRIGASYWILSEYDLALEHFENSLKVWKQLDNKMKMSDLYNNIGLVYAHLSDYQNALKYLFKSLEHYENMDDEYGSAGTYTNIGLIYMNLGDNDRSEDFHQKALAIFEKIDDKKGISASLHNLGIIAENQNRYEEALERYEACLEYNIGLDDKYVIATAKNNIGNVYQQLEQYDLALEYFQDALKLHQESGHKNGIAQSFRNIGAIYSAQNEYEKAIDFSKKSLDYAKQIDAKDIMMTDYEVLSQLYAAIGDYKNAYHYSNLYAKTKDSIFSEKNSKIIAELQTKYEINKKEKEKEIYKLKNVELVKANQKIIEQREHLHLITRILRHDLKNNLAVISSALRLYRQEGDLAFVEEAVKKVKKSNELIDKMRELELLMESNLNLKPYALKEVLREVVNNFPKQKITLSCSPATVLVDDTIFSVFENLICNAFTHGKTDRVEIATSVDNSHVIIKIADFGVGIPDSIKQDIFEESYRYGDTGNTGLGLFIVKKAVHSFGGEISVLDNEPSGTIFKIKLKKVR
jgi:signal transduction histidine kinase